MPLPDRAQIRNAAGQTTAEYALVILAAAALATMVIAWATHSNAVGRLFDTVLQRVLGSAG
ncbi:MAG: hypothetical protein QOD57_2211 [Actinomycetota bacterium]|jgi:hypothetical protein|nr:hypothetical protein [Actinomycetota bacterium]